MYIKKSYKYEIDGIVYVSGNVPDDATILETLDILKSEKGKKLKRISDGEIVGRTIWLHDGDVMENYTEIEQNIKLESKE